MKKQELEELLRNLEIEHGEITPEIYDQSQKVSADSNILHLMEACQNAIEDIIDKQVELVE